MAIYTLSSNYIAGVAGDQRHLHNVFLKFSNPDCDHKAAIDKSNRLLEKYTLIAKDNPDILVWLEWMSRVSETYFEIINVIIPENISDEETYLLISASTNSQNKVVVFSHQFWTSYSYKNGHDIIDYSNKEVFILDKDQVINDIKSSDVLSCINPIINQMNKNNNPWKSGTFYLFAFLIVLLALVIAQFYLPILVLPLVFLMVVLSFSIIGALQLKNDEIIKDQTFIKLMGIAISRLTLFKEFIRYKKKNKKACS